MNERGMFHVKPPMQPKLRRPAIEIVQERIAALPSNVLVMRMCKCGRGPWRKNQRNCIHCHRDAQKKHKASLKAQAAALETILSRLKRLG